MLLLKAMYRQKGTGVPGLARRCIGSAVLTLGLLGASPESLAQTPTPTASAEVSAAPGSAPAPVQTATTDLPKAPSPKLRSHREEIPVSSFNPKANKVRWDPTWPKFRTWEYVTTGVMGVAVFAALAIPPEPDRWRDMGSFDAEARSVLRIKDDGLRNTARDASDLLLTLMVNQLVVDATLVAWWGHDRPSVAYELVAMDLEALAVMGGIQAVVSGLASRWRPYRDTCTGPEEKQTRDCRDNKEFRSFFSGHTSGAFTVAGLMCMHHAYLPLYGGGTREGITCAASMAAAATVGLLRVVADQHFLSDALVGAAVGTLSGLGIPWLLHYRGGADVTPASGKSNTTFSVRLVPMPLGIGLAGEM